MWGLLVLLFCQILFLHHYVPAFTWPCVRASKTFRLFALRLPSLLSMVHDMALDDSAVAAAEQSKKEGMDTAFSAEDEKIFQLDLGDPSADANAGHGIVADTPSPSGSPDRMPFEL